ncbi:glycosyltransferase family 4 protein [Dyella amyloliquefaciens]|uniref:glycosyltransferase family 4 protein n=1 Tax=Dyella amyloliquefaciens TaxID=1770545 RepID=UPI00102ECDE8|nr:glycosyltransferase [Dyella amyloliquefaciens]
MATPVFFTIVSRNYLAYALTLLQSIAEHYPTAKRYLCLADVAAGDPVFDTALFETVTIDQLQLPDFSSFVFRYDIMELNTAVKPYMFEWLRQRHPDAGLLYIDPDILVLRPLVHVEQAFDSGASMVLTPHLNAPMTDDNLPDELGIMRSGVYNCGFVAINAAHPHSRDIIDWWSRKLEFGCFVDLEAGLFTDQKWMDLAPGIFPDVAILRNDGYNVAYWNLAQRPVAGSADGGYTAGGVPLVFAHFSGVALANPAAFSKHQNRFTADTIGGLRPLYDRYLGLLEQNGQAMHSRKPYGYGTFADGGKISQALRRVYRRLFDIGRANEIRDPLNMDRAMFNAPCEELPQDRALPVSRVMYEIWSMRPDLQGAFDIRTRAGRDGFIRWYLATASSELGLEMQYIEPIRQQFLGAGTKRVDGMLSAAPISEARFELGRSMLRALAWGGRQPTLARWYSRLPVGVRSLVRRRAYAFNGIDYRRMEMPAASTTRREPRAASAVAKKKSVAVPTVPGVNLVGYARGEFGVAENVRSYARALDKAKYPFIIRNFDIGVVSRQNDLSMDGHISDSLRHDVNVFFVNADQMHVVHDGLGKAAFDGRYNIGFWLWELDSFPAAWDSAFDLVDEVWAPTDFVCDAIAARTNKTVRKIPKAIEFDVPSGIGRDHFALDRDDFIFLYSYDFNSFASRKNPEAAIASFRRAFSDGRGGVRLLIKSINGQRFPDRLKALADSVADDPRIEIRDGFLSREEMFALQNNVDCYVSLHRSEGFGLGMAESMYLGKPVIATGYSGNMAFMTRDNSCIVDYKLVPLVDGDYPYWQGQRWAEADVEHAARYMRRMLDEPGYAARVGAAGAESIRRTNSKEVCANAVIARLRDVMRERCT